MRRRTLRVGVDDRLERLPSNTGHGKVWTSVLGRMRRTPDVELVAESPGRRVLRRRRPHVWLADGHGEPLHQSGPVVAPVHEIGWRDPSLRKTLDPVFASAIATRTEAVVRSAHSVIAPSAAARRDVLEVYGLPGERVHVVPYGVDRSTFRPRRGGGRRVVATATGGTEAPYVLFASVLHPRKNLSALREAMARLAGRGFPHRLVIVGAPAPDRSDSTSLELDAEADLPGASGRVVRIRDVSDAALAALMAEADVFCLPSLYEGFGLTALEAMACGAPVVVSDRGALPEVVGEAGLVVLPTAEGVEEGLERVLTDAQLSRRLRSAAIERAGEYTWERTAAGWVSVLTTAAEDAAGSRK